MRLFFAIAALMFGAQAHAIELGSPFESIDGGTLSLSQWSGQPILVVNTASRCGFTRQYGEMQALYDAYRDKGLIVLAVPSNDFKQELGSNAEVKDFCELQFGIDLPMTEITPIKGPDAHPFYASLRAEAGFVPNWNFNKVLIAPDGTVAMTFGSKTSPMSRKIKKSIEALLTR